MHMFLTVERYENFIVHANTAIDETGGTVEEHSSVDRVPNTQINHKQSIMTWHDTRLFRKQIVRQ